MKKSLHVTLSLALISSLCFATSQTFQERYTEAVTMYTAGDYAGSYALFETLWELSPEDAELNFHLGRSALELKKYDEAGIAFDRVLMA